jgi:hypothetical protein
LGFWGSGFLGFFAGLLGIGFSRISRLVGGEVMPVFNDKPEVTIKRFVVYTNENPNEFTVYVSHFERAIETFESKEMSPLMEKKGLYRFALDRALFIEQAIQEKLDREKS